MNFEWDQAKSEACFQERGFDFAYAAREILIWAPPGLQELVCVTLQEAGLQSYIRPVVQAGTPAGPDGFR